MTRHSSLSARAKAFRGWGILLGVPALFVAAYLYPRIPVVAGMEICAVKHFLGLPCPGCGLTTAFIRLTHGDIRGSIDAHPLGIVIAMMLVYLLGRAVVGLIFGKWPQELLTQRQRDLVVFVFLGALLLHWLAALSLF